MSDDARGPEVTYDGSIPSSGLSRLETPAPDTAARRSLIKRVVGWLRAGYPQGVPQEDYVVLLGLLERRLTRAEVKAIVADLIEVGRGGHDLSPSDVEHAIHAQTLGTPDAADIARVSARLAAGGWPLADPAQGEAHDVVGADETNETGGTDATTEQNSGTTDDASAQTDHAVDATGSAGPIQRLVAWLKEGYPAGVPEAERVPLLALLRRRLSDEEVVEVARRLADQGLLEATRADIGTGITKVTDELPSEEDIARVNDELGQRSRE